MLDVREATTPFSGRGAARKLGNSVNEPVYATRTQEVDPAAKKILTNNGSDVCREPSPVLIEIVLPFF